jgi:hypothetical protein
MIKMHLMLKKLTLHLPILLSSLLAACSPTTSVRTSSFIKPDPADYVSLAPAVWEYFHHRKAAVLTGNVDAFYVRYPDLIIDADPLQGINAEAFHAAALQSFDLVDGDIFPEYYEPLRVKTMPDHIEILTHGMELYLYRDPAGNLNQTGGEFKIVLYLRPDGDGWTLFRTDAVSLAEWKNFNP